MGRAITIEILEEIEQYLKGTLTEAKHKAFEEKMFADELLREEVIIQKQLYAMHHTPTKNSVPLEVDEETLHQLKETLKSKEIQALSNKIRQAGKTYIAEKPTIKKSRKKHLYYYIAASIAILLTTTLFLINSKPSLQEYYNDNVNWENLPSFTTKGDTENNFSKGEIHFKKKDYYKAIESFKTIPKNDKLYPYSLLYIGASYDQLNENENALNAFENVAKLTDFEEHSKGYWYSLLLYLKTNNKEKAKEMKTIILKDKNNYNYKKALQLNL
ncbi:hypothetical protein LXD69_13765 [Flavobacterium sediminilitoris]|uniref:Tetratricopeptide repeat protein n=1 Tax=Flavobacterium sediminilitoris TaxID=2024526 RepID=A0ABY4HK60_9FLAO|nr:MULTISPECIES: hypothetical protein [Flavobacterium]UOX33100.1 hypothetical protein LXD69_13765 [Flavobacterium sediminilitoris]